MLIQSKNSTSDDEDDDDDVLQMLTCSADKWIVMIFITNTLNELQAFQKV